MQKHLLEEEHLLFQEAARAFMKKEVAPHNERWEKEGKVDRELWLKAGEMGLLCICLLYTSPSPRDATLSRMPSSA